MNTRKIFGYGTQNLLCAFAVILALTALSLTGCDNGSNDDNSGNSSNSGNNEHQTTTNVYVAGGYYNDDYSSSTACYWKNGVRTDLSTPNVNVSAGASFIAISGSDVYFAGYYREITGYDEYNMRIYTDTACYWKNGVRTDCQPPNAVLRLCDFTVSGSDVYITGFYGEFTGYDEHTNRIYTYTACYWKNGIRTDLPTPDFNGYIRDIVVSGSDVHIIGEIENDFSNSNHNTACYWKNGVRTDLPTPNANGYASVGNIAVSGSDVYIAGSYREDEYPNTSTPCYWKNGVRTDLATPNASASAGLITVSGSDVYITGYYREITGYNEYNHPIYTTGTACYWKNGVKTDFPTPNANAHIDYTGYIAVSGSDVYVPGNYEEITGYDEYNNPIYTYYYTACYWKNGTLIELGEGAYANAITVEARE
jgi:hypothetical protein